MIKQNFTTSNLNKHELNLMHLQQFKLWMLLLPGPELRNWTKLADFLRQLLVVNSPSPSLYALWWKYCLWGERYVYKHWQGGILLKGFGKHNIVFKLNHLNQQGLRNPEAFIVKVKKWKGCFTLYELSFLVRSFLYLH